MLRHSLWGLKTEDHAKSAIWCVIGLLAATGTGGCYMYHEQSKVLLPGIDIDQTLEVAQMELDENKLSSVLTFWAMRDQVLTAAQAGKAGALYLKYIDKVDSEDHKARGFSVWHFTWAVSNMYRLGNDEVKRALAAAYKDAALRVEKLDKRMATKNFSDEKMLMGDAHFLGRSYAKKHLVVPGNDKYLPSVAAYKEKIKKH